MFFRAPKVVFSTRNRFPSSISDVDDGFEDDNLRSRAETTGRITAARPQMTWSIFSREGRTGSEDSSSSETDETPPLEEKSQGGILKSPKSSNLCTSPPVKMFGSSIQNSGVLLNEGRTRTTSGPPQVFLVHYLLSLTHLH